MRSDVARPSQLSFDICCEKNENKIVFKPTEQRRFLKILSTSIIIYNNNNFTKIKKSPLRNVYRERKFNT